MLTLPNAITLARLCAVPLAVWLMVQHRFQAAFWLFVGGLPGLFAYKAVNTADSMIGHREPRWRDFGWAAARTDDVMNLIPARIAGCLIAVAGRSAPRGPP